MPNISNRQRELEDIEFLILQHSIDNDDEAEEEAMLLYIMALSTRFIERPRMDRSKTNLHFYFTEVFPHLSDAAFKSCFRTTKEGFKSLMDLLQGHDIFYNKSTNPQAHPGWQLAVALMRIGTYGNGASAVRVEGTLFLGQGTVTLYTNRVIMEILSKRDQWLAWPDAARCREIRQVLAPEGFPGCVGFVDGMTIPLAQKPAADGETYHDRHERHVKLYSMTLQVICDVDKRIIAIHAGCTGSVHDATVFKRMNIYKNPEQYFTPGEYLLSDSAYSLSTTCVPAFRRQMEVVERNQLFNTCLAKARIRNEHCIGILKNRGECLKEMRVWIKGVKEVQYIVDLINACCVLHNMLADLGDAWLEMDVVPEETEAIDHPIHVDNALQDDDAKAFRQVVQADTLRNIYGDPML